MLLCEILSSEYGLARSRIMEVTGSRSFSDIRKVSYILKKKNLGDIIITIIIIIIVSCHTPFFPGTSVEPALIPTAHPSSFTLQYFPHYV
jgi:hypothetical protein